MVTIADLRSRGVLHFSDGYRTRRAELDDSGYRILRVADVTDGRVRLTGPDFVTASRREAIGLKAAESGDVLLTTKGTVGRVALMPSMNEPVVYSPQLCYFRVLDRTELEPRFLAYWLRSEGFRAQALNRVNNTDMAPYINLADIASLEVDLPASEDQRAIAEVLGALDDKIAANDRLIATAAELGRALFEQAMQASSSEVRVPLSQLVRTGDLSYGDGYRTKRSEHASWGFRILRAGDVSDGRIEPTGPDFVDTSYTRAIGAKTARSGDVVLTTKGTVGRVGVVHDDVEPIVYSPQVCYFRAGPRGELERGYLTAWLMSQDLQRQIETRMFKSDMAPYVNLKDVGSLEIPMVSSEMQARVGDQQTQLDALSHSVTRETRALVRTVDELLPLVMSGRLRVRDAERVVDEVV